MTAAAQPLPAPLPWFGGKALLARRIAELLSPHRAYCEVFGGSAAVLFAKERSHLEVWNDIDDGLCGFFACLREQPERLAALVSLTPFSRSEFELCRRTWQEQSDPLERARRWYVAHVQSYNATPVGGSRGNGTGWTGEYAGISNKSAPRVWADLPARLAACAQRLAGVQIERLDWREVLERYDKPESALYLDPPYLHAVRRSGGYRHELSAEDHEELVARCCELRAPCVLISGYAHPSYSEPLRRAGFEELQFSAVTRASLRRSREHAQRVEVIWRRAEGVLF